MENLNNQGKNPQQYKDSASFVSFSMMGMLILVFIVLLTSCSHRTHVITEYDGDREIRWYSTNPSTVREYLNKE